MTKTASLDAPTLQNWRIGHVGSVLEIPAETIGVTAAFAKADLISAS